MLCHTVLCCALLAALHLHGLDCIAWLHHTTLHCTPPHIERWEGRSAALILSGLVVVSLSQNPSPNRSLPTPPSYLYTGATGDVTALFSRFGADGLKLVHAAFACNPSLNRNSRQESIEAANKLFEGGGPKGKYSSALSDLYKGVTDLAVENHGKQKALTKTKSKSKSRFFG